MVHLFEKGLFRLHSGGSAYFRINCEALTPEDWATLAEIAADLLLPFGPVEGLPTGGERFAAALRPYSRGGPPLIADDVLTTGASMERQRAGGVAIGVVVFSRASGPIPDWITPIFQMTESRRAG